METRIYMYARIFSIQDKSTSLTVGPLILVLTEQFKKSCTLVKVSSSTLVIFRADVKNECPHVYHYRTQFFACWYLLQDLLSTLLLAIFYLFLYSIFQYILETEDLLMPGDAPAYRWWDGEVC